jgi:hypothetical protein
MPELEKLNKREETIFEEIQKIVPPEQDFAASEPRVSWSSNAYQDLQLVHTVCRGIYKEGSQ